MTLILGLGNKARHGKDTFAQAIADYYALQHATAAKHGLTKYKPIVVQRHAFADALYREVNEWLKVSPEWTKGGEGLVHETRVPDWVKPDPKAEVSARAPLGKHAKLLQWWGTEYRRAQDQDYWVKQWIAGVNPKADIVISTDMRFTNEAAAVRSIGGFTVQVNRLDQHGTLFIDPSRDPLHASEAQLDNYNYDFKISVKDGDIRLLEEWAITLVHYLRALKGHK